MIIVYLQASLKTMWSVWLLNDRHYWKANIDTISLSILQVFPLTLLLFTHDVVLVGMLLTSKCWTSEVREFKKSVLYYWEPLREHSLTNRALNVYTVQIKCGIFVPIEKITLSCESVYCCNKYIYTSIWFYGKR